VGLASSGAPSLAATLRPRRGCPYLDPPGPPCSHARASGLGTAFGCGSGRARSPQAPTRSHRAKGNRRAGGVTDHSAGVLGFRVDCRSRRAVSGVGGASAVVAVPTPKHLVERLRPISETALRLARQRASRSALERSSPVEGAPRPHARACRSRGRPGKAAWSLRGGCAARPVVAEEPGAPEARRASAFSEENTGTAGAPWVEAGEAA
jgi:hypothetical protein